MKLLGSKMRTIRRQQHLSQAELSQGICTQATVSMMESKDMMPGMPILMAIARRLNVPLEDLVDSETHADTTVEQIIEVENALTTGEIARAAALIKKIDPSRLIGKAQIGRYHYVRGFISLENADNLSDALTDFKLVLSEYRTHKDSLYWVGAKAGTALYHLANDNATQAIETIEPVFQEFIAPREKEMEQTALAIWTYKLLAKVMLALARYRDAILLSESALVILRQLHSSILMGDLYYVKSQAEQQINKRVKAYKSFHLAYALALVTEDEDLQSELESYDNNTRFSIY